MDAPINLPYVDPRAPRGRFYRVYARLVANPALTWLSRAVGWKLDRVLLRLTRGRLGTGLMIPTALLETRGARTGRLRRNAVIYFHDGKLPTIVAAKAGAPHHPSWFHNACADPDVTLGGWAFRAEVVEDDAARARLWELADNVFPPYAAFRERAGRAGRTIPILQLTPR